MQKTDTFEQFLSLHSSQIPLTVFTLDFCLTAILSWILSIAYVRYGTALSNRQMFARNFVMLA
ncbi:MAG: hypothetical protein KDD55_12485, partial [Bdellovibrionales bacterium]|nr:hypothetical protein [Bdellovibrionales bacterium]